MPAEAPASPAEHGALRWIARGAAIIAAAAFLGLLAYGLTAKSDNKTIDDALARSKATPAPNFTLDVLHRGSEEMPSWPGRWPTAASACANCAARPSS